MKIDSDEIGFDLDGVIADTAEALSAWPVRSMLFVLLPWKILPLSRSRIA